MIFTVNVKTRLPQVYKSSKLYRLSFNLRVGGSAFHDVQLDENDHQEWKLPALIIDYVRIYQVTNYSKIIAQFEENKMAPSEIGKIIQADLSENKSLAKIRFVQPSTSSTTFNWIKITQISSSIFLIVIIPLICFIILMQNKSKKYRLEKSTEQQDNFYDDVLDENFSDTYENVYNDYNGYSAYQEPIYNNYYDDVGLNNDDKLEENEYDDNMLRKPSVEEPRYAFV